MPIISPTPGDVHVSRTLSTMSIGFFQDTAGFVADKVFPSINSEKNADLYWFWPRGAWNRDDFKERAPGAESAGTSFDISKLPFYIPVFALHHPMPDQVTSNADADVGYDTAATMLLTQKALIKREASFITAYWNIAAWGVGAVGAATTSASFDPANPAARNRKYWSDPSSTPIEDIRNAMTYVQLRSGGFRPTTFSMTRPVADILFDHPDVIARVNAGQTPVGPALGNEATLARILGLREVLVMDGIVNAAKEGLTESNQFFGGKSALLTYSPTAVSKMMPSAGYTFSWSGYLGGEQNGTRIKRWYSRSKASTIVEAETAFVQQITSPDCGYFFDTIIV